MRKLPFIPEQAYIRHPNGKMDGPYEKDAILGMISEGSVSRFIWIYEVEKRLGTALKDLPEYDMHPDSGREKKFFPYGKLIDSGYYLGLLTPCFSLCFFLPGILTGIAGFCIGMYSLIRLQSETEGLDRFQKSEARYRVIAGLFLNFIFTLLALVVLIDLVTP